MAQGLGHRRDRWRHHRAPGRRAGADTGVDTPERGEECYQEATEYLERRVGGQTVPYRYQHERTDRYGRALLDIFRDGRLVNLGVHRTGC